MPEPLPQKKQEGEEETLQFLKREEVRTMAKDMARLREQEAKKERERITKIKTGLPAQAGEPRQEAPVLVQTPKPQPIQGAKTRSGSERPMPPPLMPHAEGLPTVRQEQKPVFLRTKTRSEKILIRAIIIGILLFILLNGITFGYWYFIERKAGAGTGSTEPILQYSPAPIQTPAAFFETLQETTINLGAADDLIALVSDTLEKEYPQGFTRILVKNEGGSFLTTQEFLRRAGIAAPEPLLSLLQNDFMLFAYSSPARKRLGIITDLAQSEGAQDIIKNWEATVEQDTKPLWEIVEQKGSAYTPFFRQTAYQNNQVRFQTFSELDFGIVYTLFETKLILTTSFESLTKTVDLLTQNR